MKKLNNKGFSLVELIIVIAIMVILVVVIAPQYTKFVNNSRIAADVQTAQAAATAIDVAIADNSSGATFFSSNVYNATAPIKISELLSKFDKDATWKIEGDDTKGVSRITITVPTAHANAGTWEVYPNPDKNVEGSDKGLNTLKK